MDGLLDTECSLKTEKFMKRGTIIAVLLVTAGVAAGIWGVLSLHGQMRRVMEEFTPATVEMMAHAPQVELLHLIPDTTTASQHAELMGIGDVVYQVDGRKTLADSDFSYLRFALLRDASYEWDKPVEGEQRRWEYILDFHDGSSHFLFAFDFSSPCMMKLEGGKTVSIAPIATGAKAFFDEQTQQGRQSVREEK